MHLLKALKGLHLRAIERTDPVRAARMRGVTIGKDCRLVGKSSFGSEPYLVTLGDHVSVTSASFITHDGAVWVARQQHPEIDLIAPIRVGNNVFIGAGAMILPGVHVGDNVVIGAMSLVTRDVASDTVVAGIPAKPLCSTSDYIDKSLRHAIPVKGMDPEKKRQYLIEYFARGPEGQADQPTEDHSESNG
jgi:acetyltransferase-like isoleucine patch superfamily enzyme